MLDQNPEIADVLNQLGGAISEDQMAELNYQVDEEGLTTEEVARTFSKSRASSTLANSPCMARDGRFTAAPVAVIVCCDRT